MGDAPLQSITPEISEFLMRIRLCFVASVSTDGKPNVSPKGTLIALDSHRLAFADIRSPDTISNIAANAGIEISTIDPISRRGYLFTGKASVCTNGMDFDAARKVYADMRIKSTFERIVIVDVETVSEVTSPVYDRGVSEQDVRAEWSKRYL